MIRNMQQINNLFEFLNSKEEMVNYWKEYPFGFSLLLNEIIDFRQIFDKINKSKLNDELLLPVMRVGNGEDILCIFNSKFCVINPFEPSSKTIKNFKNYEEIWIELIVPYIKFD